jgi:hypothetical protein
MVYYGSFAMRLGSSIAKYFQFIAAGDEDSVQVRFLAARGGKEAEGDASISLSEQAT